MCGTPARNVSLWGAPENEPSRQNPGPPDTVPPPFRGIARECLHLDPRRRCSIAEIQARLQPAGRSVPAEPEARPPPRRTVKRGPTAAALLVVALAGGGVAFPPPGAGGPTPTALT